MVVCCGMIKNGIWYRSVLYHIIGSCIMMWYDSVPWYYIIWECFGAWWCAVIYDRKVCYYSIMWYDWRDMIWHGVISEHHVRCNPFQRWYAIVIWYDSACDVMWWRAPIWFRAMIYAYWGLNWHAAAWCAMAYKQNMNKRWYIIS